MSTKRAAAIAAILMLSGSPLWAAGLSHGPMLGAMTPDAATVWFRTSAPALVSIQYGLPGQAWRTAGPVATVTSGDNTGQLTLTGLLPKAVYSYTLLVDDVSAGSWEFATAPPLGDAGPYRIVIFTDSFGSARAPGFYTAVGLNPDLALILGDWDHRNPTTLTASRTMHRVLRGAGSALGVDFAATVIAAQHVVSSTP